MARALYGGKLVGLIWIRFAAKALRFSIAKSSRPPFKMGKCKVKSTIISRFKSFQVFSIQKQREPQPEAAVSFSTVVTFVTWLISRTEFSSSELVL